MQLLWMHVTVVHDNLCKLNGGNTWWNAHREPDAFTSIDHESGVVDSRQVVHTTEQIDRLRVGAPLRIDIRNSAELHQVLALGRFINDSCYVPTLSRHHLCAGEYSECDQCLFHLGRSLSPLGSRRK